MSQGGQGAVLREVHRLFNSGTVSGLNEEELLARFVANRDEAAFAAMIARHGPMVLGVCRRWLRDPRDIEDAFQATVLIFIRKAGSIRRPHLLGAWLYGVAYRVARRTRIVAARRHDQEHSIDLAARPSPISERYLDGRNELRSAIDQEIERLPERLRLPIVLCHLEGLSQSEAAERLRTTPDSVRGRLARGRAKLRDRLIRRGLALPSGVLVLDLFAESGSAALPAILVEKSLRLLTVGPTASVAALTQGLGQRHDLPDMEADRGSSAAYRRDDGRLRRACRPDARRESRGRDRAESPDKARRARSRSSDDPRRGPRSRHR